MSDVSVFVIFAFTAADTRERESQESEEKREKRWRGSGMDDCRLRRHCKLDKLMEMLHVNWKLSYEENWTLT